MILHDALQPDRIGRGGRTLLPQPAEVSREVRFHASRAGRLACLAGAVLLAVLGAGTAGAEGEAYAPSLERIVSSVEARPGNRELADRVERLLPAIARDRADAASRVRAGLDRRELQLVRVPGLFWRSHPETGADLSMLETLLGRPVPRIDVDEIGTVEANAARVADAVRILSAEGRPVVLVSASKGSAEVRTALEADPALGDRVAAWLDLVGVLEGTPLTDPSVSSDAEVHAWLPPETARSLSRAVRAQAADPARFPSQTLALHVAAAPREGEVSDRARSAFERLRPLGPNDGYVLLEPLLRAPGRVLWVRGADHYLRAEFLSDRILALLRILLDDLDN